MGCSPYPFPVDLSIRTVEEVSAVSGTAFQPGDRVWSFLYRNPEGQVERLDCREEEREQVDLQGSVLCSWGHTKKAKAVTEAQERKAALQSAEEVFLSLYEEPSGEEDASEAMLSATRDRLKFFLALQLERKRVLRHLGGSRYRHMPTKRVFNVPQLELSQELLADFSKEIVLMGNSPA